MRVLLVDHDPAVLSAAARSLQGLIDCAQGSFCNEQHVCQARKDDGAGCAGDGECRSGYCTEGAARVCAASQVCG